MRALYEEQVGPLYSYVVRLLGGDRYRAEDVVQEALLRCWRTQDLASERRLQPWLFTVARNLVVDDYRSRKARPREVDGTEWLADLLTSPDHADALLSSMALREAFQHLSTDHREALYETFFSDRTMREAGQVLGVPTGTVKSRVHHAIRALRLAMDVPRPTSAPARDGRGPEPGPGPMAGRPLQGCRPASGRPGTPPAPRGRPAGRSGRR
ncbi:sigma-70 family RNA polymerase sigma factor [Streptomyces sp. SB3404]|uniref:Sigma-70 family RNA polymerase sigma factor n=1 Tax=Streptomyces boncukensis TaxID=2711219 RepID=A0A6G4X2H6_9ACTN|nr:sigma-70 family RNA polymerase sigma factor [Streptomyces boncukensis]